MIRFERTTSENPEFRRLIKKLDMDLHAMQYDKVTEYDRMNLIDLIDTVILVFDNDIAIGCGCFKEYAFCVEIKRMFVEKDHRGQGIAFKLLSKLESWVKERNYPYAVLETGLRQQSAIKLYQKSGYAIIPNYGEYAGMPDSVCMQKKL